MDYVLGIFYIMVVGAVLVSMAALFFLGPDKLYKRIYLGCQTAVVVWCMSQVFVLLSDNTLELAVSYVFGNLGICSIGAVWYYFACTYTERQMNGVRRYVPGCVAVFHYLCVLTNPWHHLYYKIFDLENVEHGFFFYTNVLATYVFVVAGAVILYVKVGRNAKNDNSASDVEETDETAGGTARNAKNDDSAAGVEEVDETAGNIARNGQLIIVASVLIPVFFNAVYLSGLVSFAYDITPLGFGISIILVMLATMKYNFMDVNRELAITNEKLLLEKERNRIAQQVHDTAGHTLTMIQSYMKLAQVANDKGENEETGAYLTEARTLTSQGIKELREAINEMRQGETYELATKGIMQLAGQVKEISVEVTVKGEDSEKYSHLSKILYDCTRESITNTLKYANASKMEIVLKFKDNAVDLIISDDGCGCEDIKDNNGLTGIKKRVEDVGGTVRFVSAAGEGFLTRIHIPIKKTVITKLSLRLR